MMDLLKGWTTIKMVRLRAATEQSYDIWLDEKKNCLMKTIRNPNIVARGYTDYVTIQDYPMPDGCVSSHAQWNKWWDKQDQRNLQLQSRTTNEEGTRLSAEFVAF